MGDSVIYPIDTINTRMKLIAGNTTSLWRTFREIVKVDGWRGLYAGYTSTFPCAFISSFLYISAYEKLKQLLLTEKNSEGHAYERRYQHVKIFLASCCADLFAFAVYIPFDAVRIRMQSRNPRYLAYRDCLHGVYCLARNEGLLRIYRSSFLYVANSVLCTGIEFTTYEYLRGKILKFKHHREKEALGWGESLTNTVVATCIATIITNPLDVALVRYQAIDSSIERLSILKLIKTLVSNEGFKWLSKGLSARLSFYVMYALTVLPFYEHFRSIYGYPLELE
jgi:hypothetical protein